MGTGRTNSDALPARDTAVEAEARRARDEAVRREHAAIEEHRRERSGAAPTGCPRMRRPKTLGDKR